MDLFARFCLLLLRRQHNGSRAVPEQNAGSAVTPVHQAAQGICADQQHVFCLAAPDIQLAQFIHRKKSGAGSADIETGGTEGTDFILHKTGGIRKDALRRGGSDENQIQFCRTDPGIFQRSSRRLYCHLGNRLLPGYVARTDSRPLPDPDIARIHHLFQIFIFPYRLRYVRTGSRNSAVFHLTVLLLISFSNIFLFKCFDIQSISSKFILSTFFYCFFHFPLL